MEDIDRLEERIKFKITLSKIDEEEKYIKDNKRIINIYRKIGLVACICLVITTGIVFAKDIIKIIFNNSTVAIDSAVENGYVQSEIMDYVYDKNIGIGVEKLVLDDLNLDIAYNIEIIKENVKMARFKDFTITNNNKKIVFRSEFKYAETQNELPLYTSLSWMNLPKKVNDITFSDSILFGLRPEYEKFNELFFDIKSIQIIYDNNTEEIIEGNWQFNIKINDKMTENSTIIYNMINNNEYIESCTATMSKTETIIELSSKARIPTEPEINLQSTIFLNSENAKYSSGYIDYNEKHMKIHFEDVGSFIENSDELELNLGFFNTTITLEKEHNN